MQHLTTLRDIAHAIASHRLCLFYIKAPDCGVCQVMQGRVEELAKRYDNIFPFYTDIREEPLIAGEYLVYSGPTLLMFLDGKEVYRASQFIDMKEVECRIKREEVKANDNDNVNDKEIERNNGESLG